MTRLLILGGTGEAAALAEAVQQRIGDRIETISSLAGRTRRPCAPPGEVRTGGFGGPDGLVRYLRETRIDIVVDATHPYATQISANARKACEAAGVPRLLLLRPPWEMQAGDNWIVVSDAAEAARRVPEFGSRVFLTLGSGDVSAFAGLAGVFLLLRVAEAPDRPPLPGAEWIAGRGPFREADERRLLTEWRIDLLVSRNSGGTATVGKIAAARGLAIPVIMLERPAPEPGACMCNIEETVEWIAGKLAWR
ncbi:MAG: cobalt-precorrin-6A reductase [Alphaproteobacteria bacterium]|nr:cobalt-precorrin-6A reductase [Alphaproteobacteria bacterium]